MSSGLRNGKAKPKEITSRQKAFIEEAMTAVMSLEEKDITFEKALLLYKLDCYACNLHDKPTHPKSTNCRDNPYCIDRLGMEKFQKLLKKEQENAAKVAKEQRPRDIDKMPCGLTNSGNFCYVNSFLQVWFNEPAFRQIVYDFRKSPTYVKTDACKIDIEQLMICLQRLFYFLEKSPYEDCSYHSNIISLLRLNNEQQDTLEFARMFLDALDHYLRLHPNGESTRLAMKRLYTGCMQNRLSCSCEQKHSVRSEDFDSLRLPIEGHKTLFDALDAVFASEKLECGRCSECDQLGGMSMERSIEKLPNVLMIELMRYKIDSDGRKKIKTPLMYPNEFPAKDLLPSLSPEEEFNYELFAVLIHEGDNVTCGHYYDLIKASNGKWHTYNDESIEPLQKGPGFTFTNKKTRGLPSGKVPVDLKYCYCLVYRRKGSLNDFQYPPRDYTDQWESQFETDFKGQTDEEIQKTELRVSEVQRRLERLHQLFESLKTYADGYKRPNDAAFIPTNLLSDILNKEFVRAESIAKEVVDVSTPSNVGDLQGLHVVSPNGNTALSPRKSKRIKTPSISSSGVEKEYVAQLLETHVMPVCAHGRVPIDTVLYGDVKVVTRSAAERLLARYAITVVKAANDVARERSKLLTTADLCLDCAMELKQDAIVKARIQNNINMAQGILKDKTSCSTVYLKNGTKPPDEDFYVSKKALTNYKILAQKEQQLQKDAAVPIKYTLKFVPNNTQQLPLAPELFSTGLSVNVSKPGRGRPRKRPLEVIDSADSSEVKANKIEMEIGEDDLRSVDVEEVVNNIVASVSSAEEVPMTNGEIKKHPELANGEIQSVRSDDSNYAQVNGRETSVALSSGTEDVAGTSIPSERPSSANSAGTASDTESNHIEFNDQLRCKHGGINFGEFRHRVSPDEWEALSSTFRNVFAVNCCEEVCSTCMQMVKGGDGAVVDVKAQMRDFSKKFRDAFEMILSRELSSDEIGTTYTNGICSEFVKKMQTHFKRPSSRAPGTFPDICQSCIVCKPHSRPFCTLRGSDPEDLPFIIPLMPSEWETIRSAWAEVYPDQVVSTIRILPSGIPEDICENCHDEAIQGRLALDFSYVKGSIYIKPQPDLDQLPESNGIKRTSRQQSKGNLKVRLDSTDTVFDLKVQLYRKTGQSPNDQLLYNGDQVLNEDKMTLFEARIPKDNVDKPLILIAQEMANESPKYDDCQPERGFADSALSH